MICSPLVTSDVKMKNKNLPELLSPAGSLEAFMAAIDGGADAIYMGGAFFNARINAKNFSPDEMLYAVRMAHTYGVKVYQTVNTMIYDKEMRDLLCEAEHSAKAGIDAFIVSDLGAASLLHAYLPEMPLHASTQMSIHNAEGAKLLQKYGFTRVVPARELSAQDISYMVENNPLEVEMFIHGALCVSHSGQCLFSSLVGGRSGNRGLCAQPCRLPYSCGGQKAVDKYPLSLKDLSLASHVTDIIDSGVASLKIEGRMKSPEYVKGVTAIWRRLLDEGRNADKEDMRELSELFSRGGFTDSYYTRTIGRGMLGVRSDEDKKASREIEKFKKIERKVPVDMHAEFFLGKPARLTVICKDKQVCALGGVPEAAINAPLDEQNVKKSLSKLGDTFFALNKLDLTLDSDVIMPISALNALRRDAIARLTELMDQNPEVNPQEIPQSVTQKRPIRRNVGRFISASQITDKAREFFDVTILPLDKFISEGEGVDGFYMPPVIFDSEYDGIKGLIARAVEKRPQFVVISNAGQISVIKEMLPDAKLIADFRFNIGNQSSACFFEHLGFDSFVLSPELSLPQIRDIGGAKSAIVYGRIPLMTLEKCVIKELYGDRSACDICRGGKAEMVDRRGVVFPVIREFSHRNVVLNSLPTYMSDRQDELEAAGILDRHFLFTIESSSEVDKVIYDYQEKTIPTQKVRRIAK